MCTCDHHQYHESYHETMIEISKGYIQTNKALTAIVIMSSLPPALLQSLVVKGQQALSDGRRLSTLKRLFVPF